MADFGPIAQDAERRLPTAQENETGFACGPLSQPLFNGMFYRIEAELKAVQDGAGIVGVEGQYDQVYQAILALISAAVGPDTAGDTSNFVLMDQARLRIPIFPDVITPTNGIIGVISTGPGNVRLPAGAKFLHRGIFEITTALQDFVTDANKVYHLRWNPTDGFDLIDILDGGYNPAVLAESDAAFDSTYDDMLVARVVTNSGNSPTITNLVNKDRLYYTGNQAPSGGDIVAGAANSYHADVQFSHSFARVPKMVTPIGTIGNGGNASPGVLQTANDIINMDINRYRTAFRIFSDFNGTVTSPFCRARVFIAG